MSYAHPIPIHQNSVAFALANNDSIADSAFQSFVIGRLEESQQGTPYFVDFQSPDDCNGSLGLARNSSANAMWSTLNTNLLNKSVSGTHITGSIDVRRRQNLFLHSSDLSNNRSIGPQGSRSVICRVPVTQLCGGIERREHSSHLLDYIPTGGRTLSVLGFQVKDSFNAIVNLHGGHCSFELIFSKTQPCV